jgi:ABC-type nickel/cobalt efflux system permease component RcnA
MDEDRAALTFALKQRLIWIAVAGLIVAALAVLVLAATGPVTFHLALAVMLGTFFTFMLGGGLFALSFYSARSGFDREAARPDDDDHARHG